MLQEGSKGSFQRFKDFIELVCRRYRRMAAKMNCVATAGEVVQPAPARSGSSHATTSGATTSTSAARDKDPEDDDESGEDEEGGCADEDGGEDKEDVDARFPDEMVLGDLVGAPSPT